MPTITMTENIQSNSVEIIFSNPPFLQKPEYGDWIQLTGYTVMRRPLGQEESKAKDSSFPYDMSSSMSDASPTQPRRMKLAGLMPGKKYKLTVTAHYSNGESISSEPKVFSTKPAGVCMYPTIHDFSMHAYPARVNHCCIHIIDPSTELDNIHLVNIVTY